jgi:hypothetical protein
VIGGDQVGGFGIGTGQDQGRNAHHVGGETSGDQLLTGFLGRNEHLATHVATLLDGSQLVFEVNACSTGGNHVLHQFEGVQNAAETGFRVGNDRQEVVDEGFVARVDAAGPLDLVSALEGVVDAANHGRHGVVGVQRLVRVHGFGGVAVGSDLPAGQIHGFEAGLGLLHGLTGRDCAEGIHVALLGATVDLVPQRLCTALGQGVLRLQAAAQANDVGCGVTALDELPAGVFGPVFFQSGNLLFASQGHVKSLNDVETRESRITQAVASKGQCRARTPELLDRCRRVEG